MSTVETRQLVDKLWNYCNVLRDDGVSTIDYVEQLTFLLFLKIAHEQANRPLNPVKNLAGVAARWQRLLDDDGDELELTYRHILEDLGKQRGTLGIIFRKAQNRIQDPAKLKRLVVELIDREKWASRNADVKGDAYEGLLAKGAEDVKTGAGQYFTPRPLIEAMVDCVQPGPDDTIIDPACGTGGFLIAAHQYIERHATSLGSGQRERLATGAISGVELVDNTARLAAMNMILHGIGQPNDESLIDVRDSLAQPPNRRASIVLANPPFGKKSSVQIIGEDGRATREDIAYERSDFWTTTTNKQLNFVQHIASLLAMDGHAAVVLPDNVLFEGGAGETVRRRLLSQFDVHTLLRLPTGIFYAGGVKANVLFFDKKRPHEDGRPWTTTLWVYDLRTNQHFTLKQNPLRREHLDDFVGCYLPGKPRVERVETELFKPFTYEQLTARDKANLDLTWLKDDALDDADSLLPPEVIAREIVEDLQAALAEFTAIADSLAAGPASSAAGEDEESEDGDECVLDT